MSRVLRRFWRWLLRDEEAERLAARARDHELQASYRGHVWPFNQ